MKSFVSTSGSSSEKIINYASAFTYKALTRATFADYKPQLGKYESDCTVTPGSNAKIQALLESMDTDAQKVALSDKKESETYIRIFFEIVNKVKDWELVAFSLLYLDGMLEEDWNWIENFVAIQKSHKKDWQMDLIGILIDFLH